MSNLSDRARDELFSHIQRCGVLEAKEDQRDEWFEDTIQYLGERYPELTPAELTTLRTIGERYCAPVIPHGGAAARLENAESGRPEADSDEAEAAADPNPVTRLGPVVAAGAAPSPATAPEPEAEPETEAEAGVETEPETAAASPDVEAAPKAEAEPDTEAEPETAGTSPDVEAAPETEATTDAESVPEAEAAPNAEAEASADPEPDAETLTDAGPATDAEDEAADEVIEA